MKTLAEKIHELPPEFQREVEDFVDFGSVEIPCVPADESAGSADASVLKHAPPARFSGLAPTEPDASAPGSIGFLQSLETRKHP